MTSEPIRGERAEHELPYDKLSHEKSGRKTRAVTSQMLGLGNAGIEPEGHFSNIAETLDPTFRRGQRRVDEECWEYESEEARGAKSAPIVPPLRRKSKNFRGK